MIDPTCPVEISEEDLNYALGAVPPYRTNNRNGVFSFAMGEAFSGSVHHWYVAIGPKCWTFKGCISMSDDQVEAHVRGASTVVAA